MMKRKIRTSSAGAIVFPEDSCGIQLTGGFTTAAWGCLTSTERAKSRCLQLDWYASLLWRGGKQG